MTTEELLDLTRKWERGEMSDEGYLKAVWKSIFKVGKSVWIDVCGPKEEMGYITHDSPQETIQWTRDRIEEVRMLDEEIEFMKDVRETLIGFQTVARCESVTFRLVRLLAEAKKGMR